MDFNNQAEIEAMIRQILLEKLGSCSNIDINREITKSGVISVKIPNIKVSEKDRMDTGRPSDVVYTKDVFSIEESRRLGCGIMEMKQTTFPWTLNYDEIDYIIEGSLSIKVNQEMVTANQGELILIPKGSSIEFSVPDYARFIYITYPADWTNQG